MNIKQENHTFTLIKALGIISIVIGHAAIYTRISTFTMIYSVPVFLFVSGYFFKDSDIEQPFYFIKKKIIRLYFPWLFYGILFVLLHNFFVSIDFISYNYKLKESVDYYNLSDILSKISEVIVFYKWKEVLLGPLWFLFGLFTGLMVYYAVTFFSFRVNHKKPELIRSLIIIILIFVALYKDKIGVLPGIIYRPMLIAGLIWFGGIYKKYETKIPLKMSFAAICFSALAIAAYLNFYINVGAMLFDNEFLFILLTIAGIYMLLAFSSKLAQKKGWLISFLKKIGNNTLTIMSLHYLSFKLISLIQMYIYDYPINYLSSSPVIPFKNDYWWIIYTIAGILIPLGIGVLYDIMKKQLMCRGEQ